MILSLLFRWLLPPTEWTSWILPCSVQVVWTGRSSSPCQTKRPGLASCKFTLVRWMSAPTSTMRSWPAAPTTSTALSAKLCAWRPVWSRCAAEPQSWTMRITWRESWRSKLRRRLTFSTMPEDTTCVCVFVCESLWLLLKAVEKTRYDFSLSWVNKINKMPRVSFVISANNLKKNNVRVPGAI